jgi:hypothetical protein
MVAVALLCPLINASGAVGALMPIVMLLSVRLNVQPSRFLMPMAFSSGAGAHLALTGAPKNVLIADAAGDYGNGLNFFEFALVGIPILVGTWRSSFSSAAARPRTRRAEPSAGPQPPRPCAGRAVPPDRGRLRAFGRPVLAHRRERRSPAS